ncbi:hypothetical protein M404DRAFT_994573 [Pisolithus tinctorius Marx 270]|uniref:Uncharacterized protein n=1 Tax=Pisolithus tinctorius Marx 270 TaxID=870435 RepID=A0A0C3PS13_PISTI|nr:hypothetical protein M404DRAFT_994573 [Pisolithus tinctorius Marx 270]
MSDTLRNYLLPWVSGTRTDCSSLALEASKHQIYKGEQLSQDLQCSPSSGTS